MYFITDLSYCYFYLFSVGPCIGIMCKCSKEKTWKPKLWYKSPFINVKLFFFFKYKSWQPRQCVHEEAEIRK